MDEGNLGRHRGQVEGVAICFSTRFCLSESCYNSCAKRTRNLPVYPRRVSRSLAYWLNVNASFLAPNVLYDVQKDARIDEGTIM